MGLRGDLRDPTLPLMKLDPRQIALAAETLRNAQQAWALTGAGVSTPSGIPDFRGPGGLWELWDPEEVSSLPGFLRDPQQFYTFWLWRFEKMEEAQPNVVHHLLARLEEKGLLQGVITQNIDGLHHRAGSRRVLEVHGHVRSGSCLKCRGSFSPEWIKAEVRALGYARCPCGGLVKPDVVLFGEELALDFHQAHQAAEQADVLFVLGTSLEVWPVAGLVPLAAHHGAKIILANRDPTRYDAQAAVLLRGELVEVALALGQALGVNLGG